MTKQELATKIWATANVLRKNIKASEYKDYILGFMFYKYLCDKEVDYLHSLGGEEADLLEADDKIIQKFKDGLGYFIAKDNLFSSWKNCGTNLGAKNIADAIEAFYLNLNGRYKTVFDKVFGALQSGLSKLGDNSGSRDLAVRDIIDLVDYIPPTSKNYDVLGYIYEYLIKQFSSEAKKDGAFYTPHELTTLMARITAERLKDRKEITAYDPTAGSCGLLLYIGKEIRRYVPANNIKYYGQELITETANLAKMNLFMQGIPVQNINMRNANTLKEDWPYFDEDTSYEPLFVDACCSNPPYSQSYNASELQTDERFKGYGLAPETKADYAFLLHCLYHIKKDGILTILLPHGVLFRSGSEYEIRKNLVLNHNIETIVGMPANLFFSTGIPICLIILSKNNKSDDILFIDASQSFTKGKNQNILKESDVQRIFDTIMARKDVPNYAHLASMDEIKRNDYNLNIARYVSATKQETPYDFYSVMTGKVSDDELAEFNEFWMQFPKLKGKLITGGGKYHDFVDVECKKVLTEDSDVQEYLNAFNSLAYSFKKYLVETCINPQASPTAHSEIVSKLFELFKDKPLVDVYAVFQAFADHWPVIDMDLSRIEAEGWSICSEIEPNMVVVKDPKTKKTTEEQRGWKGKIFSFDLIEKHFFSEDFDKVNKLIAEADSKNAECLETWESIEDESVKKNVAKENDEESYDIKKFKAVIKNLEPESANSLKLIIKNTEEEKEARKQAKEIIAELERKAKEKLLSLTKAETEALLEEKWITPIIDNICNVSKTTLSQFTASIEGLEKKYESPLDSLSEDIAKTGNELKEQIKDLTGNEHDMKGFDLLLSVLEED